MYPYGRNAHATLFGEDSTTAPAFQHYRGNFSWTNTEAISQSYHQTVSETDDNVQSNFPRSSACEHLAEQKQRISRIGYKEALKSSFFFYFRPKKLGTIFKTKSPNQSFLPLTVFEISQFKVKQFPNTSVLPYFRSCDRKYVLDDCNKFRFQKLIIQYQQLVVGRPDPPLF